MSEATRTIGEAPERSAKPPIDKPAPTAAPPIARSSPSDAPPTAISPQAMRFHRVLTHSPLMVSTNPKIQQRGQPLIAITASTPALAAKAGLDD